MDFGFPFPRLLWSEDGGIKANQLDVRDSDYPEDQFFRFRYLLPVLRMYTSWSWREIFRFIIEVYLSVSANRVFI